MKNFFKLGIIAMVAVIGLSTTACDQANEPGSETGTGQISANLVGTWVDNEWGDTLTINANGTFTWIQNGWIDSGTFSVSGNSFTMTIPGEGSVMGTFSQAGNTLTLFAWGEQLVFTRQGAGPPPPPPPEPGNITWTARAVGFPSTTRIEFDFSASVPTLLATDITITSGTGSATRGALSGTGAFLDLAVSNVSAGTVSISINRAGIASGPQTVTLVAATAPPPPPPGNITWTARAVGSPTTMRIEFDFSASVPTLLATDITITSGTGSATRGAISGSGAIRDLAVSNVNAGTVSISINRAGIASGSQTVTLAAATVTPPLPGNITWTVTASGSPTTTTLNFNFSAAPTGLVATDITIAGGTGSATRGALSGTGATRTLAVSNVSAGTISVSINRAGIDSGPRTVTLVAPQLITWTATPTGSPTTNNIAFNFSAVPTGLTASDFTITSGTGSATRGALSGIGTMRNLVLSNVSPGTVTIAINRAGIAGGSQTVTLTGIVSTTVVITGIPAEYNGRTASIGLVHPTTGVRTAGLPNMVVASGAVSAGWQNRSGNYIVSLIISLPGAGGQREYRTFSRNISAGSNTVPWFGNFAPFGN